jgi:hypothetical protein
LNFALVDTRPPFVYQQIIEKATEFRRLGMSARTIAKILKVTDKTVAKALRHYESGAKRTEPCE